MTFTIAMPEQKRLRDPFESALKQAGFMFDPEHNILVDVTDNLPDISTLSVRDVDALADICDGTVHLAPVGLNALTEFNYAAGGTNSPVEVVRQMNVSCCRLSLAGTDEDDLTQISDAKGRLVVTSYPASLIQTLSKVNIESLVVPQWQTPQQAIKESGKEAKEIATIIVRKGGVEEKAQQQGALAFDLIESGRSLRAAGFNPDTALPVLESQLVLVQSNMLSLGETQISLFNQFLDRVAPQSAAQDLQYAA